jgi:hypothetical protein
MWISILSNFVSKSICVCTCMWISILSNVATLDIYVCTCMWISILSNSFLHIYVHTHVYVRHIFFRLKFYPLECTYTYTCRNEFDNIEIHMHIQKYISVEAKSGNIEIHIHVHTYISKVATFDNIEIHIHVHTHILFETKIVVCPFVLFLLAIVMSVLLRYADSDYPFGIFKLFLPPPCYSYSQVVFDTTIRKQAHIT